MQAIEYKFFAVHGTEGGAIIAGQLATMFPENCVALHSVAFN